MKKILITGFEPFGDYAENSSWAVAERVAARGASNAEVVAEPLPVSYRRVAQALRLAVAEHTPDAIILLGQSALSSMVKLERVALNLMDAARGDNDGYTPDEEPIDPNGAAALFTDLPIKRLHRAIAERNVAVKISNSAGLYVCNRTYFEALSICREQSFATSAIFVHLPLFEGQASANPNAHTMPIEQMTLAVETIIDEVTKL